MENPETAYILTGGQSRRFGQPKCIAEVKGKPLMDWVAANLKDVFSEVFQVGKQPYGSLPFVPDISENQNPLTGVITALKHCPGDWAFVIACDLPLVNADIIQKLHNARDEKTIVVLPEVNGYLQYTCGFYHKSLLRTAEAELERDNPALYKLVKKTKSKAVIFNEGKRFLNVNRKGDLEELNLME